MKTSPGTSPDFSGMVAEISGMKADFSGAVADFSGRARGLKDSVGGGVYLNL
jgi:hypothetical protein